MKTVQKVKEVTKEEIISGNDRCITGRIGKRGEYFERFLVRLMEAG